MFRKLFGLTLSQFFGAFNDNAWKLIVFVLATRCLVPEQLERASQTYATLSLVVFLIPMFLFSFIGGAFADRMSKKRLMIFSKALEVLILIGATAALYFLPLQLALLFTLLGCMGAQSALFGPGKYGILPEILPEEKLSKGNGLIEMWTMFAIIAGTGLGPILLGFDGEGTKNQWTWIAPAILSVFSLLGLLASFTIPKVYPASTKRPSTAKRLNNAWKAIRGDRKLLLVFLGGIFYWLILSLLGQNILVYAKALVDGLERGELWQGIPPAAFGIGIGIGAVLAGKISDDRIEYGLIPLGSIGFAATSFALGMIQPGLSGTVALLIIMGLSIGLLVVPVNATLQVRAPKEQRGSIIALRNACEILGMIAGSLLAISMVYAGFTLQNMLIYSSFLVIAGMICTVVMLPEALIRLGFILLTKTFYRIHLRGKEFLPRKGGALLVANHLSVIDAFFLLAAIGRPIRFIMKKSHYDIWYIKPFAKVIGAIPIANTEGPRVILKAIQGAGEHLEKGRLVCIFPEGQTSRTGMMQPFQRGAELIVKGRDCPVIPINLDCVWGSIFSFQGGKYYTKHPTRIPYPITITFGKHLKPDTSIWEIRKVIQDLGSDAWMNRKKETDPIHYSFIRNARWSPFKFCLADEKRKKISRIRTLTGAVTLARLLKKEWKGQKTVGLLLPPIPAAVMLNIATAIAGKTSVNLNYTAGKANLDSAIEQNQLQTIVTSKLFVEKLSLELPAKVKIIYVEDLLLKTTSWKKFSSLLFAYRAPIPLLEKICGRKKAIHVDDVLTVIFTSGSTGNPKGVELTHFNIDSNSEAIAQVTPPIKNNKLLGILPFFHSFGYMTLWLGLNHGIGLVLHPNPLDSKALGSLIDKHKISIIMTTPTFLRTFFKKITPEQLGSVKVMLTGAERLPQSLADKFEEIYGIRPIEGYGVTECSAVIATSTLDYRGKGVFQHGSYKGSVGHALPGVMVRVVAPDTKEELPPNEPGMLLVKGPNVMKGYLNRKDLTNQVMHGNWYITGDIASIDEQGYITIVDRLSRFSKIGGEMLPLVTIEDALHKIAETNEQVFAVSAIPDEKKGERLAILHTLTKEKIDEIIKKLPEHGFSNLFIPKLDQFLKVESLPYLGTGKLDLKSIKTILLDHFCSHLI